jgi:hypothetical protein
MMPSSEASGSDISRATVCTAETKGWPTRSERTISSTASGSCSSSFAIRFFALAATH